MQKNRSTGPRTEAGKQRSSQNAIKHGAYAKKTIIKGESEEEFIEFLAQYFEDFEPRGITEEELVFSLADNAWRRRRFSQLEGRAIEQALETGADPSRTLANYTLSEQRMKKTYDSTLKTLKEQQADRLKHNNLMWRVAVIMLDYFKRRNIDWDPAEDGFVFSKEDLERQLTFNKRADEAMSHSVYYTTTKEMDERWAKQAA
jgi:hypothetical protein